MAAPGLITPIDYRLPIITTLAAGTIRHTAGRCFLSEQNDGRGVGGIRYDARRKPKDEHDVGQQTDPASAESHGDILCITTLRLSPRSRSRQDSIRTCVHHHGQGGRNPRSI